MFGCCIHFYYYEPAVATLFFCRTIHFFFFFCCNSSLHRKKPVTYVCGKTSPVYCLSFGFVYFLSKRLKLFFYKINQYFSLLILAFLYQDYF